VERDAVVVEVALNEAVTRAAHAQVPHSPDECAADAMRCADAGATIVHWHAVDAGGAQRLADVALSGAALDAIAGRVPAYPSYPVDVPDTVDDRLAHCFALRARHGLELGPVDVTTVNLLVTDPAGRAVGPFDPVPGFDVIRNSLPFVVDALDRFRAVGLVPTLGAFDVGSTRTVAALAEAGMVPSPVLLKIFLWETPAIGPVPSVEALDLHLRQLPADLDVEWLVVPYGMGDRAALETLGRAALERGGGVRVGIGDNPLAFPDATNAELVERVARWAEEVGRPLASVDEVRTRLGLTGLRSGHD
jgi:uncharacterized protein (DUF849 family)